MSSRMRVGLLTAVLLGGVACDKAQLLAPTNSTVTLTAAAQVVPVAGSTQVTAFVLESGGTPVQNGTTVRFSTNLGRVEPTEAQTTNGYATATYLAGAESGVADVRAVSGAAGATTGDASNVVQILVGAAAVDTVILGANPSSVPATGGTVTLLATVTGAAGQGLGGVTVTFVTTAGQLSSGVATTDASGQARTMLTTSAAASVTASAGTKTSATASVTVQAVILPVTATLGAVADAVVSGVGHRWTFTANVTAGAGAPQPSSFEWTLGDGTGVTTNGNTTAHVYGPSAENSARIVRVTITLSDGSTISATTEILIGDIVP